MVPLSASLHGQLLHLFLQGALPDHPDPLCCCQFSSSGSDGPLLVCLSVPSAGVQALWGQDTGLSAPAECLASRPGWVHRRGLSGQLLRPRVPFPLSAADIYIEEHFHRYVSSGHPEATPLRVMYTDRPPSQTDAATLQYCCLTGDRRAFRPPTRAELEQHRIVVTTTSQARELRVPAGFFSHILIDEAAQMLECEALTPLRYASPSTRVVLAGDHMQVTPKLFSVARAQAAAHTLLYRLFQHYQQEEHEVARHSRIVFHENYRSTEAILSFVSRHFYVAKGSPIHASGKVPRHPKHYPLMFCHVAGSPERDMSRTSWLNAAEIVQVTEKVQEIYQSWPPCWGGREQRSICAVSHGAQVSPSCRGWPASLTSDRDARRRSGGPACPRGGLLSHSFHS